MPGKTPALVVAGSSTIHGTGLFAARDLVEPQPLIEYRGEVIGWDEAVARYDSQSVDDEASRLTYYFDRGNGTVIDGARRGNAARFINHGCEPNCEAIIHGTEVWIYNTRPLRKGAELLLDYGLVIDGPVGPEVQEQYTCHCNATTCRRSMLAP